jgi:glycosyltransferase involved in cell wall biosynthesis
MIDFEKISIITPSYNQGDYIERTIKSVLEQGYPNFEHIIIDGGSTDRTLSILKSYSHLIWISEKDNGQADAVNKGFNLATGKIVGWINYDDVYLRDAFYTVISFFQKNPEVEVVYGDGYYIDDEDHSIRFYKSRPFDLNLLISMASTYILNQSLFFRKSVLTKVGEIDTNYDMVMDYEFTIRLGLNCKVAYIPIPLGCWRKNENIKSSKYISKSVFGSKKVRAIYGKKDLISIINYKYWDLRKQVVPFIRNLLSS